METRLKKLEDFAEEAKIQLARIEAKMDTTATKVDLAEMNASLQKDLHALTWKIFGTCSLLVAATYFIAKYLK